MGNIGILILGAVLIIAVLFIGYKMDTAAEKAPKMRAPKKPKAPKKKVKVKEEYDEEPLDEESDDKFPTDLSDDNIEDYTEEVYESDDIEQEDLVEDSAYEDEDVSLFSTSDNVESTFNNDIDNELSFETEEPVASKKPVVESYEPEELPEEKSQEVDDFSSTMIFDTDKLNGELEEIDKMDDLNAMLDMVGDLERVGNMQSDYSNSNNHSEPEDFSEPVYDIDDKIKALDEDDYSVNSAPVVEDTVNEGPIKPDTDDAESFMNQLKKLQETAEADDFSGFVVDNKDKELKETHKRYTKKKSVISEEAQQISFMPEENETEEDISLGDSGMDMNFLAEMEKNLKANQKERLAKNKTKKTTKKDDK